MNRILFVDDEPAFLESLRILLRRQRSVWDMAFALGAQEALDKLAKAPFDVVVSDMRMPGMDGAELLRRVKELDPCAARLVLSGYADPAMFERAVPVAQQYLAKPCSAATLRSVLERVCELQRTLSNPAVREQVGRVDQLPALPESYRLVASALEKPGVHIDRVVEIVARDPAMSAKVLQLANSAYIRPGAAVTSVAEAVRLLGPDLVLRLPMMMHAFDGPVASREEAGFSLVELQQGSIATARLAARFAVTPEESELAFTAGLLHEIGRILLVREAPAGMAEVVRQSITSNRPASAIEHGLLGTTHAEVGAYLLGMWGLPLHVVEAVAYHHSIPADRRAELRLAVVVHAADTLLDQAIARLTGDHVAEDLDLAALEACGLTHLLPAWREMAEGEARAMRPARDQPTD